MLGWRGRGLSVSRPVCHGSRFDGSWGMAALSCFREFEIQGDLESIASAMAPLVVVRSGESGRAIEEKLT